MTEPVDPTEAALAVVPSDGSGPVFRAPWEAQAFAVVVALHKTGCFTWTEWAAALSVEVARAKSMGDPDLGDTYYRHWLAALETLLRAKRLTDDDELHEREHALLRAAEAAHAHEAKREPVRVA